MILLRLFLMILLLGSCSGTQFGNPTAGYGNPLFGMTMTYNAGKSSFSASAYDPTDLEGESCVYSFFSLFAFGNGSVNAAATSVHIKNVRSVSHQFTNKWMIAYSVCTIVRGTK